MRNILEYLIKHSEKISFAESMTGGALAAKFIENKNASLALSESFVLYSNEAKIRYLNISPELIKQKGVVSSDVAHDMAKNLYQVTKADLCVATTGYAEGMNPNKCYIGIYYKGHIYIDKVEFLKDKTRKENIDTTVSYIFDLISKTLKI